MEKLEGNNVIKVLAFNDLLEQKSKHKKMRHLEYKELKIQGYLTDKKTSLSTKRTVFRMRTHMEEFKMNYKSKYEDLKCSLCSSHKDSQEEGTFCEKVRRDFETREENMKKYMKLFDENIPEETIELIFRILKRRETEQ